MRNKPGRTWAPIAPGIANTRRESHERHTSFHHEASGRVFDLYMDASDYIKGSVPKISAS